MTTYAPIGSKPARWISTAALALAVLYSALRGPLRPNVLRFWDYAVCVSSASLWIDGRDPYDAALGMQRWRDFGPIPLVVNDVGWLSPIVAPTTLVVLAPFAALPAIGGAYLYLASTIALASAAAICCGRWAGLRGRAAWQFYFAGLLASVPMTFGLTSGNPAMLAVPILLIGAYRSRGRDDTLGGVLIGIATAAKLQIGLPVVIAWWLAGRRRTSTVAASVVVLIAIVAIGRLKQAHVDWWPSWSQQVAEVSAPGAKNDFASPRNRFDLVSLQTLLWHLTHDRLATQAIAIGVWLTIAGLAARQWWKYGWTGLDALCVAGPLLLLPIYHRTYDGLILMPVAAVAIARLSDRTGGRTAGIVSLVALSPLLVPKLLFDALPGAAPSLVDTAGGRLLSVTIGAAPTWGILFVAILLACGATSASRPAVDVRTENR